MENLVAVENNEVVVSSLQVAENFGKQHKDVLESIRQILTAENSAVNFFKGYSYLKRGKQYPAYYMNRDGFSLLVMGFTGEKALDWKIKYINAFNNMEKELKEKAKAQVEKTTMYKIGEAIRDIGDATKEIMAVFKCKEGMAQVTAIDMAEEMYSVNFTPLKRLVPAEPNPSTLNPTQIGKRIGKSAKQVNQLLATKGYQVKDGDTWVLTDKGIEYGEAKPYKRHGHSGYQIVWNEKVFNLM